MRLEQRRWTERGGWDPDTPGELGESAQLVLVFGNSSLLREKRCLPEIKKIYPRAHLLGCSTAGEICGTQVFDDSLVITAIGFAYTQMKGLSVKIERMDRSHQGTVNLIV